MTLSQISIYSNTIYTEITTHALALRLVSSSIPITTGNIIILHNGSTMTGASRLSASRRAGWAGQLQATTWPKQCGRRKQICGLLSAAEDVNSLARLKPMNQVGGKADTCGGLSTDTYFLLATEPKAEWP